MEFFFDIDQKIIILNGCKFISNALYILYNSKNCRNAGISICFNVKDAWFVIKKIIFLWSENIGNFSFRASIVITWYRLVQLFFVPQIQVATYWKRFESIEEIQENATREFPFADLPGVHEGVGQALAQVCYLRWFIFWRR